jgi:hypothetical protein
MPKRTLAVLGVAAFAGLAVPFGLPQAVHASGTYTSISIMPFPIAQPGSLTTAGTTVNICVQPRDAAGHTVGINVPVWLSFYSGLFTSPANHTSTAFVGTTPLTATPAQFLTVGSCTSQGGVVSTDAILVVYTTPTPTIPPHGRDVIIAADSAADSGNTGACPGSAGSLCNNATYVYSPVTQYVFSSGPTIAPSGSLGAGQQAAFTVTAEDSAGNFAPGAFLDLSLTSSAANGGTATGWNHHLTTGFTKTKITNSPQRFGSDNNGAVQIIYTAASPLPTTGTDTITAQDHVGVVTASGSTTYTYGSTVPFTQAPYTPITPHRVCDTRPVVPGIAANQCNAAGKGPLTQGQTRPVTVTGGLVPSTATAIVVNFTAIAPTKSTFIRVYPAGGSPPTTSNLNPRAGAVVANLIEVAIGTAGQIDVFNDLGTVNIAIDVEGYVDSTSTGLLNATTPARICDTRAVRAGIAANQCNNGGTHPIGPGRILTFNVASAGSPIPTSGVLAVVFNLTAISPSVRTVLTAYAGPSSSARPTASNINVAAGAIVPNRVIVPVPVGCGGTTCTVNIWNSVGSVNVAVDVDGWFEAGSGAQFTGLAPARLCDTRFGTSGEQGCQNPGTVHGGTALNINATGIDGLPVLGGMHSPTAVVLNVTVVNATTATFVTVYPGGFGRPNASDLNVPSGFPVTNLVVVGVGADGTINLFNDLGNVNLVVDVLGYYS